jgi:transposase-like protein
VVKWKKKRKGEKMKNNLKELLEIIKRLPEKSVEELLEKAKEIKEEVKKEEEKETPNCPHCGEEKVVKNGRGHGKQTYICRECKKSFTQTSKTAVENSHMGEAVWKAVIRDTINGISLEETAGSLDIHHETAFNMRHKILYCIEEEQKRNPIQLSSVSELDECYILNNYKGKKFADDFHRKPRKHGAKAGKSGISDEYISVCCGVERDGAAVSVAVCKSQPTSEDISSVFIDKVNWSTLVLCDGTKSYDILEKNGNCSVIHSAAGENGFKNINAVNGFHSFIKERNNNARGFATKYLNRYSSLFSLAYRKSEFLVDDIYNILTDSNNRYTTIADSQSNNLLSI